MNSLPFMPLYVADYLADTAHFDAEEHGAYLLLIFNYWQRGEALPDDDHKLARIARVTDAERWLNVRSTVVEHFIVNDGKWVHERIEKELSKAREKTEKARIAGQKSAEQRASGVPKQVQNQRTLNGRSTDAEQTFNYTDTDTDTHRDKYKPPKGGAGGSRFQKPQLQELDQYFQEIGLQESPQKFFDYYQSNGWKVGKNPMKDWRATARQWKARRETEKAAERPKPSRYRRVEDMTSEELEAIQS